ncbi:copper resistance D domain-containing protein [Thioalkalivibrio sulfidiphilus HL-EbGr7]|uniref:Copper resistance protein D n=1 Tax=Thioalkalivibrio sulfidiphilus (strain HL-EbGR7) TaxID=396588 RepID=B8GQ97_THISH|nr:CopD family protein [Thioalkalivibrio sulfidiphilus]ACL72292.1 copper resistance D domain-containing protein [Thioalkalivibrio sulfidiphilus HL-EbGr7]
MDAWTLVMVLVAAGFYTSSLLAVGTALFKLGFLDLPARQIAALNRIALVSLWTAITLALLQWPLQAGFLGGGTLDAALDPMLLGIVFDSAQGNRTLLAVAGLLLLHALLLRRRAWQYLALPGGVLVLLAFVQVGHTQQEPRWLLGGLLLVHLATASFWIGALIPLYRVAGNPAYEAQPTGLLTRFGRLATTAVALLLLAGVAMAWLLAGGLFPLFTTAYGQILLAKIALVTLLLGLAALNKLRLVPAYERGDMRAPGRLRRSILLEGLLVSGVFLLTALLTTTSSPGG